MKNIVFIYYKVYIYKVSEVEQSNICGLYLKMIFFLFKFLVLSYLNLLNCNRVIIIFCRD